MRLVLLLTLLLVFVSPAQAKGNGAYTRLEAVMEHYAPTPVSCSAVAQTLTRYPQIEATFRRDLHPCETTLYAFLISVRVQGIMVDSGNDRLLLILEEGQYGAYQQKYIGYNGKQIYRRGGSWLRETNKRLREISYG